MIFKTGGRLTQPRSFDTHSIQRVFQCIAALVFVAHSTHHELVRRIKPPIIKLQKRMLKEIGFLILMPRINKKGKLRKFIIYIYMLVILCLRFTRMKTITITRDYYTPQWMLKTTQTHMPNHMKIMYEIKLFRSFRHHSQDCRFFPI